MITRRTFLRAGLAVAAAPFIVRASSLMHVRALPLDDFTTNNVLVKGVERLLDLWSEEAFADVILYGAHFRDSRTGERIPPEKWGAIPGVLIAGSPPAHDLDGFCSGLPDCT